MNFGNIFYQYKTNNPYPNQILLKALTLKQKPYNILTMFKQKKTHNQQQLADCLHFYNQYQLLKCLASNPLPIFPNNSIKQRSRSRTPKKPQVESGRNQNQTNGKYKTQKSRKIQTVNSKNKAKRNNVTRNGRTIDNANFERQAQDSFERQLQSRVRQFDDQIQMNGQAHNAHFRKQELKPGLTNIIEQLAFGPKNRSQKNSSQFQDTAKFSFNRFTGQDFRNHNEQHYYNEPTRLNPTTSNINNKFFDNSNLQASLIAVVQRHQNNNNNGNPQLNSAVNLKYKQDRNAFLDSSQNYNFPNANQIGSYHNSSQATFNNQNASLRQTHLTYTPNNYNNMSFEQQYPQSNFRPNMNQSYEFESPRKNLMYLPASREQRSKSPLGGSYSCNDLMGEYRSSHSKKARQSRLQMERPFYQPKASPLKNKEISEQKNSQVKTTAKKTGSKLVNQLYQQIDRQFKSNSKKQFSDQQNRMFKKKRLEREQQIKNLQLLRSESNQEDSYQQDDSQDSQQDIYQQNTEYQNKNALFKTQPRSTTTQQISQNIFSRGTANNQSEFRSNNTEGKAKKSQQGSDPRTATNKKLKESLNISTPSNNSRGFQPGYKNKVQPYVQQESFQNVQNFNRKKLQNHFTRNSQSISQVSQTRTIPRPVAVDIYAINKSPKGKR